MANAISIEDLTRFEKARIVGARALQIAMGAPVLAGSKKTLEPIALARMELEENVIPITVKRKMPEKLEN